MPIYLKDGRLPKSADEIILPVHLATNGGVRYKTGDTLKLDIGEVTLNGNPVTQNDSLVYGEGNEIKLTVKLHRTFKVVGIYERPSFEYFTAPGYTALTVREEMQNIILMFISYIKTLKMLAVTLSAISMVTKLISTRTC